MSNQPATQPEKSEPTNLQERIIVAIDVPTIDAALALCDRLPQVGFWKVGLELFVSTGAEILTELKQRQKKIFLDLKLHDIPNTVAAATRAAVKYEVDFLTVHAVGGRNMLKAAQAEVVDSNTRLLAITLLTSLSSRELAFDLKIPLELPEYALQMALMAQDCGLYGAVCSPLEVSGLRSLLPPNPTGAEFGLVTPGIRPAGSEQGDQRRTMTPAQAIAAGASYLVIGRPITQAEDPAAAWQEICAQLSN
ncbi:orotidine-5'-phosphate decarboxylase [Thalassoporum mexicanum PCC 7367]|uniref:orotidine-5'-phosphate decarboxylase n=1 Tax=Thalassoporum mexicanum TaxID=3457544 RepID=UPI00029F9B39|nr:orotidine-5'-phosphate decarboxylase [Pseudanabaena sp. PCC 7367]AFY70972.1 orotidine-5'-phosphate decarboxylase [Pseudanabaena sp. PCC 7367]